MMLAVIDVLRIAITVHLSGSISFCVRIGQLFELPQRWRSKVASPKQRHLGLCRISWSRMLSRFVVILDKNDIV